MAFFVKRYSFKYNKKIIPKVSLKIPSWILDQFRQQNDKITHLLLCSLSNSKGANKGLKNRGMENGSTMCCASPRPTRASTASEMYHVWMIRMIMQTQHIILLKCNYWPFYCRYFFFISCDRKRLQKRVSVETVVFQFGKIKRKHTHKK